MKTIYLLEQIREWAGKMSARDRCEECIEYITITDTLSLFPHCAITHEMLWEILDRHEHIICKEPEGSKTRILCAQRKHAVLQYLSHCEKQ